jgi:hypothetical protein
MGKRLKNIWISRLKTVEKLLSFSSRFTFKLVTETPSSSTHFLYLPIENNSIRYPILIKEKANKMHLALQMHITVFLLAFLKKLE